MARPPLPVGAHGEITATRVGPKTFEARCRYRDRNGIYSRPSAAGPSSAAAKRALRERLTQLADASQGEGLTRNSKFSTAIDLWVDEVDHRVRHGEVADGTARTYKSMLTHVRNRLQNLYVHEVTVAVVERLVADTRDTISLASAKTVRTILSSVCGLALRHGAMDANPVKSIRRLSKPATPDAVVTAMTLEQVHEMWAKLRGFAEEKARNAAGRRVGKRVAVWADLAELSEAMLATGVRIGEVLALRGGDVIRDVDGRTVVVVCGHIVRVTGEGLRRDPWRKGRRPGVELGVPPWSEPMWRRRKLAAGDGPLFASLSGGWLDPSNTINRLRQALDACGFDWLTSHDWRHTVAQLLDEAGLSNNEIADQLGNTPAVVETHYRPKRKRSTRGAGALESIRPA